MQIKTYQQAVESGLIKDILIKVVSRNQKSKKYTDVIPLDGGTVGIAHWAVGGLADLYRQMDTQKYFSKTREEMIESYSESCRPPGKSGNDTGWGCYAMPWWRKGMEDFVSSDEGQKIQDNAYQVRVKELIEKVISMGWDSPRQIAIAIGISNSVGSGGFYKIAKNSGWDAEKALLSYVGDNDHRQRRADAINQHYPLV